MSRTITLGLCLFMAFTVGSAAAQEDEWDYTIAPYLWAAALDGTTAVAGRSADVDANFSDLLDNLELGGMLSFQAEKGRWGVLADAIFVSLAQDGQPTRDGEGPRSRVEVDQTVLEALGTFELSPQFELLFGGRYSEIDLELNFLAGEGRRAAGSQDWVDPVVGGRARLPLGFGELRIRGDIGGFGVGSELTWQLGFLLVADLSPRTSLSFGYRIMDIDYEDDEVIGREQASRFEYDVQMSGLLLGVGFRF